MVDCKRMERRTHRIYLQQKRAARRFFVRNPEARTFLCFYQGSVYVYDRSCHLREKFLCATNPQENEFQVPCF